jgi:hypothetical protein
MLRDSPCGGTSKGATVAVTTRGVPLQMETNNKYCSTLVHFMQTANLIVFCVQILYQ